jgi:hypothetical protein
MQDSDETPISRLQAIVGQIGHPEFPFLHREYSPGSRVPCADFTGFIVERLQQRDVHSIVELMHEILRGSAWFGSPDPSWIDAEINAILAVDFQRYICFSDSRASEELAAMWIIAAKDGASREFWISPDAMFTTFFSWALCAYGATVKEELFTLVEAGNKWLEQRRKEAPFWQPYPDFEKGALNLRPLDAGPACAKLMELPIGARLHVFSALNFGVGSLPSLTGYKLRSFGLYIPESVRLILDSKLLVPAADAEAVSRALSKEDLARECQSLGVEPKKSWNKKRLLEAMLSVKPQFLTETSAARSIVGVNSEYVAELSLLVNRCEDLERIFRILCFAA